MQPNKEEIKKWLKDTGRDRFWLAEQCDVEKVSVDGWFSRNKFPAKSILVIRRLMDEHPIPATKNELHSLPSHEGLDRITIEVEGDLQIQISKKAQELGMTISCWASLALEEAAEEPDIMERIERRYAKKNPTGAKSAGKDGAHGNIPKSGLSPERRYLRAAKLDESETA